MKLILTAKHTDTVLCNFLLRQLLGLDWIDCSCISFADLNKTGDADIYLNVFENNVLNDVLNHCAFLRGRKKSSVSVAFWNQTLITGPTHFPLKSAGMDSAFVVLRQEYKNTAYTDQLTDTVSPADFQNNTALFYTVFADIINELKVIYQDKPDQKLKFVDNIQLSPLDKQPAKNNTRYIYPIFDSDNQATFQSSRDYKILRGKFDRSVSQIKGRYFEKQATENNEQNEYKNVAIIGGGTAGYLTALLFKAEHSDIPVTLIESSKVPVIGVGEATSPEIRRFLFEILKFPALEFYQKVKPTWKLGIKFFWGLPGDYYFNYPFGSPDIKSAYSTDGHINKSSLTAVLMDQDSSFVVGTKGSNGEEHYSTLSDDLFYALHLDNARFINYLKAKARERGIEYIDDLIVDAERKEGSDDLQAVIGENGMRYQYDFYVDCSGFRSLLLEKTLKSDFIPYNKSLFTDTAITGNILDVEKTKTYTYAESMNHGWCWGIPMRGEYHRGYVFSSSHCSIEEATQEFLGKNPGVKSTKIVRFRSGRHREICIGNVFAIGNSFAFVEPLESTGIHMIIKAAKTLVYNFRQLKKSPALKRKLNDDINDNWDYLRNFLSIHYKFNKKFDTPFWKDCREYTDISGIKHMVDLYYETGPLSYANNHLLSAINSSVKDNIFGLVGFDVIMMGQGEMPKNFDWNIRNKHIWEANIRTWKSIRSLTVPVGKDLDILNEHLESKW
jgi:tryptophan halogenase